MGWLVEAEGLYEAHEGFVADVLVDGRVAGGTTGGGVIVHELTDADIAAKREVRRYDGSDYIDVVVPWDQVKTWRVTCTCGWTGTELPATTNTKYGWRDCPEEIEDRVFLPSWQAHMDPLIALGQLGGLAQRVHALERELGEKVLQARAAGASWSDVGRKVGLSKQGAQQRWGHLI